MQVIRERMGPDARVLSVNQVNGQGLARFLSSPKLEIIAAIPPPVSQAPTPPPAPAATPAETTASPPAGGPSTTPSDARAAPIPPASPDAAAAAPTPIARAYSEAQTAGLAEPTLSGSAAAPIRTDATPRGALSTTLRRLGFEASLLVPLEAQPSWREWQKLPIAQGLAEFAYALRRSFERVPDRPIGRRVAFFGTPGSGKTTALCQRLAHDIFLKNQPAIVAKLENENPNANDALQTFCDVLGVPLHRDPTDVDVPRNGRTYLDLPGLTLADDTLWTEADLRLRALGVETRVLVANAAYDVDGLKEAIAHAHRFGATHLVLTHLDEVRRPARLWQTVLTSGLTPWFFGTSQSVTESIRLDVFAALLERTFPHTATHQAAA